MSTLLLPFNEPGGLCELLARQLSMPVGSAEWRRFPDGESYLRIEDEVIDREVVVMARLSPPDPALFALLSLADTLIDLGASRLMLVLPYLPYMRQDTRFQRGEAISSRTFAKLLSSRFSGLITVDPHLHRYASLNQIYTLDSHVCHAAPQVVDWIRAEVSQPLLIGPDEESEQWVTSVAEAIPAPATVLRKVRHGDRQVEVSIPDVGRYAGHTPVLVDDIISTGRTMIETTGHLAALGLPGPVCIGTHGVFADDAYAALLAAGAARVVTSNSLPHHSNAIDLSALIAEALVAAGWQ